MPPFFDRLAGGGGVCAHRGARSLAPENTLLALELAMVLGADLWEADVRLDGGGRAVLIHDATCRRTTDCAERPGLAQHAPCTVGDLSPAEIDALDAGSWFLADDPFGTVASGEAAPAGHDAIRRQRVPTLEAALHICRAHAFPMNIEIKDETTGPDRAGLVAAVLDAVARTDTAELVLLSSFNHERLREARRLAPGVPTAALVEGRLPDDLVAYLQDLDADALHPRADLVDAALIATLRAAGLACGPWTVNDPAAFHALRAAGAVFVCTDWPQRVIG